MCKLELTSGRLGFAVALTLMTAAAPAFAATRTYWIAADEVDWDYAPLSFAQTPAINLMSGQPFTGEEQVFVANTPELIGHVYRKSIYREYTANWAALKPRTRAQRLEMGTLGPVIRGVVGDTIVVQFKNNTRFPASVHPHGVLYDKSNEGAPYTDSADDRVNTQPADDAVPPGSTYTYVWGVPNRAGPGPKDGSSVGWPYHSHVDEPGDTNGGLVGFIVITQRGKARRDGTPRDVDRELFSLFTVFDENASIWLDYNVATFGADPNDPDFEESNLMHAINGYLWGNNKIRLRQGQKVRWYQMGMGTEVDLHTPHWHGITVLFDGHRVDTIELLPAATKVVDFRPDNPGTWMYHCHVNDHLLAGMMTKFTVRP